MTPDIRRGIGIRPSAARVGHDAAASKAAKMSVKTILETAFKL